MHVLYWKFIIFGKPDFHHKFKDLGIHCVPTAYTTYPVRGSATCHYFNSFLYGQTAWSHDKIVLVVCTDGLLSHMISRRLSIKL